MVHADQEARLNGDREVGSRNLLSSGDAAKLRFTNATFNRVSAKFRSREDRKRQQLKAEFP